MLECNNRFEDRAFLLLLAGVSLAFLWMLRPFFDVIFLVAMARSSGMGESFESMPRVRRPASGVPPTDFRKMRNS